MARRTRRTLLRAVAELVNAVNGLRPLSRGGYGIVPVFAFGGPTTELAPLLLTGSALDALRRGRRGDFSGPYGRTSLALTVATWAILALTHRRGMRSAPHLNEALRDALGPDYASASGIPATAPVKPAGMVGTALAHQRYVERSSTVSYGPHGRANTLDIWRHRDLPLNGRAPVLVHVPGGGWVLGWRRGQGYPLLAHMAALGWVCVSIDYRVSPRNTWPDHIVDVKRALAWVKDNISEFGGDPGFVAITGGSAGGHMASLAALTPNDPQFQPGFADADTSVAAAVPVCGRYDWFSTDGAGRPEFVALLERLVVKRKLESDSQIFSDASPIRRLTPDAPPFFVVHGSHDSLIPVAEARAFVAALREVSASPVGYAELPCAQHAFDVFGSARSRHHAAAVGEFLSWAHAHHK